VFCGLQEVTLGQVLAAIGQGRMPPFAGIYGWLLSKLGRDMGVVPGAEFSAAMRAAKAAGVMVRLPPCAVRLQPCMLMPPDASAALLCFRSSAALRGLSV
jgi:hypothetical protein